MAKCEVIVVGAGIFGLWTAWACLRRGLSVSVIDRGRVGAGASGGPVGALAPHAPERWNAKKQFQLEALLSLPGAIAELEVAGGGRCGYGRVGRLQPLANPAARALAEMRAGAAREAWGEAARMAVLDAPPGRWLDPAAAPLGVLRDDLSARLDPPATCVALVRAIRARGGGIRDGLAVSSIGPGQVHTAEGTLAARAMVVAAGAESFPLLAPFLGPGAGGAVKGQALLLAGEATDLPILYDDGIYVVPHADGTIAVGSTSEKQWADSHATDAGLDEIRARAESLCPRLRGLTEIRRWAGLRPRAGGREPMLGPVPGAEGLFVATGGYKTSFGIAHRVGAILAAMILGVPADMPPGFRVASHLAQSPPQPNRRDQHGQP